MKIIDERKVLILMIKQVMSKQDLATVLNKSYDSTVKKLRGDINFTLEDCTKMMKRFNCEFEDILTDKEIELLNEERELEEERKDAEYMEQQSYQQGF